MTADNLVYFNGVTRLDLPPDRVLQAAVGELEGVIVIGYTKEGAEYFKTNYADGGDMLWLLERCKIALLRVPEDLQGESA